MVPVHKFQAKAPVSADRRDSGCRRPDVPAESAAAPTSSPRANTKAPCDASWSAAVNRDRRRRSIEDHDPACDFTSRSIRDDRENGDRKRIDSRDDCIFLFLEAPEEVRAEREEKGDHLDIFQASVSAIEINFGIN